jgi:hypothetical protein
MAKAIPSDAARLLFDALAATGLTQVRQFTLEQRKLDRLLELRAEIDSLRSGRGLEPVHGLFREMNWHAHP